MIKRNEKILVTGAAGLAGSAVVSHLRDNYYTDVVGLTREDCDLRDTMDTVATISSIQPAHIFHPAATVYGLGGNMSNQGKAFFDNTLINTNVIHAAYQAKSVKKITVMGTNCVYPFPPVLPYQENNIFDGRPDKGELGYAWAKRHMLSMLEVYQQSYGLEYCYIVSGNLYGPRDKFNPVTGHVLPSLIAKFYAAKQSGGNVSIWGDGSATRDFLYVKDLARIVHILMSPELPSGAINIGNGTTTSIRRVVEELSKISGVPMDRVEWDATKPNGRPECYADLSKLRALGFLPGWDLCDGMKDTWEWFVEHAPKT